MRDVESQHKISLLHPSVRKEVAETIDAIERGFPETVKIRIVQGLRTIDEQNALFAQGRTKPGSIVTNARGGSSYHNYGLAIDFAIMYDKNGDGKFEVLSWDVNYDFDKDGVKDWQEVVTAFKAKGWGWGGDWNSIKDNPHLEKTFGYSWRQLLERYNAGTLIPETKYVDIQK